MRQHRRESSGTSRKPAKPKAKQKPKRKRRQGVDGTRFVHGYSEKKMPPDAIWADPAQQVANNSYSPPPTFYADKKFVCVDCGCEETWTAPQQKWYYEVAKGSLYATAVRCRACRAKRRKTHNGKGDPNPIKHSGTVLKRIRLAIEPALIKAGFQREKTSKISRFIPAPVEYSRFDLILRCSLDWHSGDIVAETMDKIAEYNQIGRLHWGADLEAIAAFSSTLLEFLRSLPSQS